MAEFVTHEQLDDRIREAKVLRDETCRIRHDPIDANFQAVFVKLDKIMLLIIGLLISLVGGMLLQQWQPNERQQMTIELKIDGETIQKAGVK